jgi:glycosyltransferase involved in cell wall biosynthesis
MHNASGIGTYIKSIVPFLAANFNVTLIGNAAEIASYTWSTSVNIIDDNTRIYSIKEQWMLFRKIPTCDVFWSPHYNVPIFPIRAKKRIVTIHDVFHLAFYDDLSFKQKVYARLVINQAVRKSDVILTDSVFSSSEIKKHTGHDINHIVGCAIDFNRFHIIDTIELVRVRNKYNLPEKFILFVGNIKPHKNLKKLLLSLEKVSIINLVIVGKKDGFITGDDELAVLINNTAFLKNRVHFTGYVKDEDIPIIYNLAKLFVFPSLYEGFGIPPLEAQACGCPVITSNAASLPEVCGDSVIYCDPYSVDDIANKINMVLSDGALQNELRARGFENIKRFSWEKSAQQIINIIEDIK